MQVFHGLQSSCKPPWAHSKQTPCISDIPNASRQLSRTARTALQTPWTILTTSTKLQQKLPCLDTRRCLQVQSKSQGVNLELNLSWSAFGIKKKKKNCLKTYFFYDIVAETVVYNALGTWGDIVQRESPQKA